MEKKPEEISKEFIPKYSYVEKVGKYCSDRQLSAISHALLIVKKTLLSRIILCGAQ